MTTNNVPSPCMSICALDEEDVCIGCGRTGMEVSYWGRFSQVLKRQVVANAQQRKAGQPAACVWQENKDIFSSGDY
ncbi:MAG TPA: DUF1289 domain-containing protein [Alcanivoracaceae bacterium]|nr:DUF1289 domain-containing protein [Alcanivoracaceae bacterium]